MKELAAMCEMDRKYVKVLRRLTIIGNAAKLLGGRRGRRRKEKGEISGEGGEGGEEEEGGEDRGEGGSDVQSCELRIGEKIELIEILVCVIEGGGVISGILDEEELMEVVLELEEEARRHIEEAEGGEEGEEKDGEMREWEELSERAHELVWVMETMKKGRRRGRRGEKRKDGLEWMEKRKEEEIEKENSSMKKNSEEMERENYRIGGENRGMKEEMDRTKEDNVHLKELCPIYTSLDDIKVTFSPNDGLKREGNTIITNNGHALYWKHCFIGEVMTSVYNLLYYFLLSITLSISGNLSDVCISLLPYSPSFYLVQYIYPS